MGDVVDIKAIENEGRLDGLLRRVFVAISADDWSAEESEEIVDNLLPDLYSFLLDMKRITQ